MAGPRGGPLRGYLDMHVHLMAHLAHGKKVFSGDPAPIAVDGKFALDASQNYTINWALSPLRDVGVHEDGDHGLGRDTIGDGTKDGSRSEYGAPYFTGWPKWTSTTHQQAYYTWLERAWRGGLRAITLLAVTNEALCKSTREPEDWPTHCDRSMGSIDEQLAAARDFERFIDAIAGHQFPDGKGWFRIVETPAQARQAIASGRLAVVLGIEVDNLFNCKEQNANRPNAPCPDMRDAGGNLIRNAAGEPIDTIAKAVAHYHALGVRHVFPVHNFDNAFGAAATWQDVIGVGQAVSEQRWWRTENCGDGVTPWEYGFWINSRLGPLNLFELIDRLGFDGTIIDPVPDYTSGDDVPGWASCNRYGLNLDAAGLAPDTRGLGKELIQAFMAHGMLIDVDHMSNHSLDETLVLMQQAPGSEATPYPVVASHVQFFDLHPKEFTGNKGRHERMRTWAQLEAIRAGGGMIAAMLKDDVQDTDLRGKKFTFPYESPLGGGPIADDCRHSSKTWAQAFQWAVDVMGGPVAMGSDFNGIAGHLGPRFGSDACGGWEVLPPDDKAQERVRQELAGNRVQYPFMLPGFGTFGAQVTGFRTFDYNVDGLAHIGLLPDLVADLKKIGLNDHYLDMLMCSAEQYIRVWERAEALAAGQPVPDPLRPWQCVSPSGAATITVDVATSPAGGGRTIDFTVAGGPAPITETFQLADTSTPLHDQRPRARHLRAHGRKLGTGRLEPFDPLRRRTVRSRRGRRRDLRERRAVRAGRGRRRRLHRQRHGPLDGGLLSVSGEAHHAELVRALAGQRRHGRGRSGRSRRVDPGRRRQCEGPQRRRLCADRRAGQGHRRRRLRVPARGRRRHLPEAVRPHRLQRPTGRPRAAGRPARRRRSGRRRRPRASSWRVSTSRAAARPPDTGWQATGAASTAPSRPATPPASQVTGDGNTIELGSYEGNSGPGIAVTGNGNTIEGVKAITNGGHGIQVVGNANKLLNVIAGDNARGNGGDGINLAGHGNEVSKSRVHANRGDGLDVTGGTAAFPNVLRENLVGDQSKGNGGHGIFVHGDVATAGGTIEIYKNTVKANAGDGIHLDASATGHDLQKNVSGGRGAASNLGCEYAVSAGNFNAGGNLADGVAVARTNGAFPSGCLGTP